MTSPSRRPRPSGRVIVRDPTGACLLAHAHTHGRAWLFTPGGATEPGEDAAGAARRELREETSIRVDGLTGPVLFRRAHLVFLDEPIEALEVFWLATLDHRPTVVGETLEPYEEELLGDWRWLTATQLRGGDAIVYPACLPDLLDALDGADTNPPATPVWGEVDTGRGAIVTRGTTPPPWTLDWSFA